VSVTRVVESVVNVTLIWHVVGAVNVLAGLVAAFRQELPVIVNGEPELTLALPKVTDPLPAMLTVTTSAALVGALVGVGVIVGIPNVRYPGEAETEAGVAISACEIRAARQSIRGKRTRNGIRRKLVSRIFIVRSLERLIRTMSYEKLDVGRLRLRTKKTFSSSTQVRSADFRRGFR
jgi:hypothetical protein